MDLSGVRQRIPLPLSLNEVDRVAQYAAHMAQHELLDDVERVRERLLRAQARQEEWQAQQTALDEADEAVRQRVAEAAQSELSNAAQCAQLIMSCTTWDVFPCICALAHSIAQRSNIHCFALLEHPSRFWPPWQALMISTLVEWPRGPSLTS